MIEKQGEEEKTIIPGHLFLNKEDKKTAKSDLQNFFFLIKKGVRGNEKQETKKKTTETNNKKDEKKRQIKKKHPNKGISSKTIGERRNYQKQNLQNVQKR